eukprot:CAMPEP_0204520266 /NCGR_PEP_ID=MMETSP0661-20131031/5176_1 /ASSEMBLY_ACC=CAM_ASM_000606 /TAXON_ID=109239 /ORGANISM="Alexandrium margalefi, Strain AMGDE01CS-322" /LENGTH=166 /DNA_ID=CAMNT_0051525815 /DNA_START=376 /DNA_END=872 /DNA_ORIENTATION=+
MSAKQVKSSHGAIAPPLDWAEPVPLRAAPPTSRAAGPRAQPMLRAEAGASAASVPMTAGSRCDALGRAPSPLRPAPSCRKTSETCALSGRAEGPHARTGPAPSLSRSPPAPSASSGASGPSGVRGAGQAGGRCVPTSVSLSRQLAVASSSASASASASAPFGSGGG